MLLRWASLVTLAARASSGAVVQPPSSGGNASDSLDAQLLGDTLDALQVMQDAYFKPWIGTWPTAIDWTAAVMGSHIAGALQSLSDGFEAARAHGIDDFKASENRISLYFSHLTAFYFGQDAFSLRNQAYDDMLWVVLGWLDSIKFAKAHSKAHYGKISRQGQLSNRQNEAWYGNIWSPAFSHRARIFWHLAANGWDTVLCGGGMNWNPKLMPYKNAITNELYIAASIAMYLHFPGDSNTSPFRARDDSARGTPASWPPHDPKYIEAAVNGYNWLASSNMTNSVGLFADGFHISGYSSGSNNTKCDERDEMVYTYNQGVILTGQRGLYEVTGDQRYLHAGHTLIHNVIKATGWDMKRNTTIDDLSKLHHGFLPRWHGLGRAGILEDACDMLGECSQDAQTFKGIWMHHFTAFCAPLEPQIEERFLGHNREAYADINLQHVKACRAYAGWLRHNANAARKTRDQYGRFGMWWTAGLLNRVTASDIQIEPDAVPPSENVVDYRNVGVPNDSVWKTVEVPAPSPEDSQQRPLRPQKRGVIVADVNDRGRGRTVETQSGGLALLRALWEISRLPRPIKPARPLHVGL